jgi:hypothetical protein
MRSDRLSYRSIQRLLAVVVALHNAEEAVTAATYLTRVGELVESVPALRDSGLPPSLHQLYTGLVIVTLVPALLIVWATTGGDSVSKREVVSVIATALLWNVFLPHLSAMVIFRGYAPGGLTALAINLPFCIYFFRRSLRERILTPRQIVLAMILGLFLLVIAPLLLLV